MECAVPPVSSCFSYCMSDPLSVGCVAVVSSHELQMTHSLFLSFMVQFLQLCYQAEVSFVC
jgi:hypothetical protein